MTDDILKAYGQPKQFDKWIEIMDYDPELGFNPFYWVSRKILQDDYNEWLKKQRSKPGLMELYQKYRRLMDRLNTEEMLKGQAFGL